MKIKIQPKELKDFTLPYPYFIDKDGYVGRQDFWKGKPYKLLGFSKEAKAGKIELNFVSFWKKPSQAVNMYPVFADKKDNWATLLNKIESVEKDNQ